MGYATLVCINRKTMEFVQVGTISWSQTGKWYKIKLNQINDEDRICRNVDEQYDYVELILDKIKHWEKEKQLPYFNGEIYPWEDKWWLHLESLLKNVVQIRVLPS